MITFWVIMHGRTFSDDEFGRIYTNGIQSWQQLDPAPEIIVFGIADEHKDDCERLGLRFIEAPKDEGGTILVNQCVHFAETLATHRIKCYLCPDLLLGQDFINAVVFSAAFLPGFLLIGRRYDHEVPETLTFQNGDLNAIRLRAQREGNIEHGVVVSYLIYTHNVWGEMPNFHASEGIFDNYLV